MAYSHPPHEPIAIVGSGCRFPGDASSPSKLWDLLLHPRDVSKKVPETRFNPDGFYHVDGEHHGTTNVTKSYFLEDDPRLFDCVFFNITPREAEAIDPQQRLLLETVYESMESAGLTLKQLQGTNTSVYVGLMTADYTDTQVRDPESFSQYMATGTSRSLISNRVSYFFDWHGPSMTVDTACSSSLTAVHLAIQSLRGGESSVACVAGANLLLGPELFIGASSLHMISPSGRSQMWDANADGYARGEGIAAVFLKNLSNALADGDHIEAIIRETGVNSDGRTKGITLPSSEAQAALIQQTYMKAGLDLTKPGDRPQYFEAHGTGTQAGDPREASAIHQSFFGHRNERESRESQDRHDKLFVGSIKTIIGHTGGTAGIAGLLKVSLAMHHRVIPPNQHLQLLNPSVAPSYGLLQIPIAPTPWPEVSPGSPLRSSVNSFGFGGTNAHAIVESYEPEVHNSGPWGIKRTERTTPQAIDACSPVPLLLSAHSEKSLVATVEKYAEYLKRQDHLNLRDLAWTLQSRRSALPVKAAFSGLTKEEISAQMDAQLKLVRETSGAELGFRSKSNSAGEKPRILGVFTGQGAQWPTMGRELIMNCARFSRTIDQLEKSLGELPDPPEWSLKKEIMAPASRSRLHEAALSQPSCTALQVALVDLLTSSGVIFHTVVGHSSGEIGAAYAAGLISAEDAVRIAYYRGVHVKLAGGKDGIKGSMIAVGLGVDEAKEFCAQCQLKGRLSVAASNAPTSVTLSGDEDAVKEAKNLLDLKGTFARILKVDTAYHSHHMYPCAEPYLASLASCNIQVAAPGNRCAWRSSVYGLKGTPSPEELTGTYWRDNMVKTVLFSQAVECAQSHDGPFDFALEVGPHAALKGPATQILKELSGSSPPYSGVLDRKKNDVVAFGDALGMLWVRFGSFVVDFDGYASAFHDDQLPKPRLLKDLPAYSWEHPQILWRESRVSKQFRTRPDPPHELLGTRTADDTEHEPRWRNILKLEEIPWLKDHRYQGQIVIPAAAYCVMALEASTALSKGKPVRLIQLHNLDIHWAISMSEDSQGIETLFSLKRIEPQDIKRHGAQEIIRGEFTLSAAAVEGNNTTLRKVCTGVVRIHIGQEPSVMTASRTLERPELEPMNIERFYASMLDIGLSYTGAFRGLTSAERRLNVISATVEKLENSSNLPIHPTWLDVCFQTLFAAFASPGDTTLWTTFLPKTIGRIAFTPSAVQGRESIHSTVHVDTYLTRFTPATTAGMPAITGDVHISIGPRGEMEIQVEDLTMSSFAVATEADDRKLYLKNVWVPDMAKGTVIEPEVKDSLEELAMVELCERVAYYYLRKLRAMISPKVVPESQRNLFNFIDHVCGPTISEQTRPARKIWGKDSHEDIMRLIGRYPQQIDFQLMKTVGENLLSVVRGKTTMIAHISAHSLFDRLFEESIGFSRSKQLLASAAKQIAHRYPRMNILEIGAGPASSTKRVLEALKSTFSSYTLTETSSTVITDAEETSKHDSRMLFKTLNIERDLAEQGFLEQTFDLVIASIVLHTATSLGHALKNIRRLMRPGGYLLILEPTGELLRFSFMMCGRPEWWCGVNDGREFGATISPVRWDSLLRKSGFAGVDSITYDFQDMKMHTTSVMVTQAIDEQIRMLRQPLLASYASNVISGNILMVGGKSLVTARIMNELYSILSSRTGDIITTESFESLDLSVLPSVSAVVSLEDLDMPVIKSMNAKKLEHLQQTFRQIRSILWITRGSRGDNPYHTAMVGLGRSIVSESPHLQLQFLDIDTTENIESTIAESLLRLLMAGLPELKDSSRLWTTEPEIVLEGGKTLIPRVLPLNDPNDRLNSMRRVIAKPLHVSDMTVKIAASGEIDNPVYTATEDQNSYWSSFLEDHLRIQVSYCTAYPVSVVEARHLHVCVGSIIGKGDKVLTLATSNASSVTVPTCWQVPISLAFGQEAEYLEAVARHLTARSILNAVSDTKTTILFEPEERLASTIQKLASCSGKKLIFLSTTSRRNSDGIQWRFLDPHAPRRTIRSLLPPDLGLFLNLSIRDASDVSSIVECLPASCTTKCFFQVDKVSSDCILEQLQERIRLVVDDVKAGSRDLSTPKSPSVISASDLVSGTKPASFFTIVDWASTAIVPTFQKPIDATTLFFGNKTYLLVGLTGELGQSICRWMVENGARHLVVSSRTPQTDPKWKEELQYMGATIRIEPMDVTDKQDLIRVYEDIQSTMPPIAGVANGAMVLSDGLFADMTFASFDKVLKPKVDGSTNLDEVFSSQNLDFFIMFSSLSAVIGNPGQANYAAANMYMVGLAAQRRKRGLAACVLDIGMILGIGYIQRTDGGAVGLVETSLRKQNFMPMAESDIHHLFAEAIVAGRPDSNQDPEIITGLQRLDLSAVEHPSWHANPRFSHHVVESGGSERQASRATIESVKQQLSAATSIEDASKILQRCFSAQLASMLQLPPDGVNVDIPIIDLGIDSLVAVEIRSWFLKEIEEDLPVLKVLGGASVADLCDELVLKVHVSGSDPCPVRPEKLKEEIGHQPLPKAPITESHSDSVTTSEKSTSVATPLTSGSDDSQFGMPDKTKRDLYKQVEKMSFGQSRLWFPSIYLEDQTTYNCTTSYRLTGPLDIARLEKSFALVTKRHQSFRTSFFTDMYTGQATQAISETSTFKLKKIMSANVSHDVEKEFWHIANHPYDLEAGDTFIATLLRHGPESHTIIFGYHHIIMDGVSWQLFLQDLETFYNPVAPVLPPPSQYVDFARKQRNLLESGGLKAERAFWKSEFSDLPAPLPLFPFAKVSSRKSLTRYATRHIVVHLESPLISRIKRGSQQAKTTTFHFYISALQVLLHRFLNVEDMCIGIADANRTDKSFLDTVGFLLNFLPLRFHVNTEQRFTEVLRNTRTKAYAALGNSAVPFDTIVQDLNVPASSINTPLFQVLVNYRMGALKQNTIGDLKLDFLAYEDAKNPFDLALSIDEKEDGTGMLTLSLLDYLYDKEGGDTILDTYLYLLEGLSADISLCLNEVSLFDKSKAQQAIDLGTAPKLDYRWPETLSLRIDDLVREQPDEIAVKDTNGLSLTYLQTSERANAIANALQQTGVIRGSFVALFCEQGSDIVCSLLAIMRIGAVYIPLDVRSSTERLSSIVTETRPKAIVCHDQTYDRTRTFQAGPRTVLNLSSVPSSVETRIANCSTGSDPAFLLFTSGSTGKPKGILLTHSNYVAHVLAASERMGLGKEVVLQQSALGFDASLAQIFYGLANGGTLILASNRGDPADLAQLMLRDKVTFTLCVPSEYSVLLQYGRASLESCHDWRVAMCGGEVFAPSLKPKFRSLRLPDLKIFNAYGPTEISVACSIGEVRYQEEETSAELEKVPIGPPLPNYAVHILDERSEPVPVGWPGEICIGGPAVALGYFQDDSLTAMKFVPDKINNASNKSIKGWTTIYHTGDKGRMLSDGSLVFLGRMDGDSQIKLRGIRIELGDISSTILERSNGILSDAAVGVRGGTDQFLVAYVVFSKANKPADASIYLRQLLYSLPLPSYMQPAVAIPLDSLPLTASGKLDTKALNCLPIPYELEHEEEDELTELEVQVKQLWAKVLSETEGSLQIRKRSDFFSVGGNSLLLLRLQVEIRENFQMDIPLAELFLNNTLESLALRIGGGDTPNLPAQLINWEAETSLSPDLLTIDPRSLVAKESKERLSVLLTGSTGFLGRAILKQLVDHQAISRIRCVAIRKHASGERRQPPLQSEKIIAHTGDLSLPLLGMSEEEAAQVFQDVDVIIHNGADVSFMKAYQSLRGPNVESTKELVRLALTHKIPIHYVSTAGVAHLSGQDALEEVSVAPFLPPVDGSDGYVASKWASERFLEKTNERFGLHVWIHRPSSIVGEDAPSMDVMHNTLKFSRMMKAVPNMDGWTGYFDFIAVDSVAQGIVGEVLATGHKTSSAATANNHPPPGYIHHCGETVIPTSGFKEYLEREENREFRTLSLKDWVEAARQLGLHELVATFLSTLQMEGSGGLNMPMLAKSRKVSGPLDSAATSFSSHLD